MSFPEVSEYKDSGVEWLPWNDFGSHVPGS
jgi:hypothetical protein